MTNYTPVGTEGAPFRSRWLRWRIGYDTRGAITEFADPNWTGDEEDSRHLRRYTYDSLGRLTAVQDPNAGRNEYRFDDLGRLVSRLDPLGQVQEWEYGKAGRLLEHRVRNSANAPVEYTHRYHYDTAAPSSPLETAGAANLIGKLSWLEFPTGEEHYSYDAMGRVQEQAHRLWNPSVSSFASQTREVHRANIEYRADGKVTKQAGPGGFALSFGYNERGGLTGVSAKLGAMTRPVLADAQYDHRGSIVRTEAGNGVRACSTYNERAELVSFRAGKGADVECDGAPTAGGGFHNLRYRRGYDSLINAIEDLSSSGTGLPRLDATFEYDSIQQLIGVQDNTGRTEYTYDSIQNLVRQEIDAAVVDRPTGQFGYGEGTAGPNALTSAGGATYQYDAAGQMQRYNGFDLRFDPEGRLVEASNVATGIRTVQHYDDGGTRRLALVYRTGKPVEVHRFIAAGYQIHDGEEVWLAVGGSVQVEVVKSKGVLVDAYLLDELTRYASGGGATKPKPLPAEYMDLNGDGQLMDAADVAIALAGYQNEARVGGEKLVWKYTTTDHLGGASHTTDSAGDVIAHQRFHAYGNVASRKGQKLYQGGYAGKETEPVPELGLQRIGARYYASALGRWVTSDPLFGRDPSRMLASVLEANLYSYARNNPIALSDPSGLEAKGPRTVYIDQFGSNGFDDIDEAADRHPGFEVKNNWWADRDEILSNFVDAKKGDIYVYQGHSRSDSSGVIGLYQEGSGTKNERTEFRAEIRGYLADGNAPSVAVLSACKSDQLLDYALQGGVKVAIGIHNVADMNIENSITVGIADVVTAALMDGQTINQAVEAGNEWLRNSGRQQGNEVVVETQEGVDRDKNLEDNGL